MKIKGTYNFSKIRSLTARNILRGISRNIEGYDLKKSLKKIKNSTSTHEYKDVVNIIRSDEAFKNNSIFRYFNQKCPKGDEDAPLYNESEILKKINENKEKLLTLLEDYKLLYQEIFKNNAKEVINILEKIEKKEGVSILFLKKLTFIKNNNLISNKENIIEKISIIEEKIETKNSAYISNCIKEICNHKTNYFNITNKVLNNKSKNIQSIIARDIIKNSPENNEEYIQTLNAYFQYSLIDAVLYFNRTRRIFNKEKRLDNELIRAVCDIENVEINKDIYNENELELDDFLFFREAPLIIDILEAQNYRLILGTLYNRNELKTSTSTTYIRNLIGRYFSDINSIEDISPEVGRNKNLINTFKFNSNTENFLENSTALVYALEKNSNFSKEDEEKFVKLMSYTRDIGLILSQSKLEEISENKFSEDFKLVISCLRHIGNPSTKTDFDLRKNLEENIHKNSSEIIPFLEKIYSISTSVAEHLITVCDETMLNKFFHTIEKPNMAIEKRAEMLAWYGNKTNDNTYTDRARNLLLEIKISKEKATIDDSRIYIEPIKYVQWMENQSLNNIIIILDSIYNNDEIKNFSSIIVKWSTVSTGVSKYEQLANELAKCYAEFCTNKIYGIASYLGRRIRHGTFKGNATKDIQEISNLDEFKYLFQNESFKIQYERWLKDYEISITDFRDKKLHIRGKSKPEGLISTTFDTPSKEMIANAMLTEVIKAYTNNNDINLNLPHLILEYCWRIIELDLEKIRNELLKIKSNHGVFTPSANFNKQYRKFSTEVNSIVAEKFRVITSWFNKPSTVSSNVELNLLIQTIISEISASVLDFSPKTTYLKDELTLSGKVYLSVYDALFILIQNAAIHGKKNGILLFTASPLEKSLRIEITSEIDCRENENNVKERIYRKLNEKSNEDAHVREGNSGIEKLKQMLADGNISDLNYDINENNVTTAFSIGLEYWI
ncbi:hypothetical protein [Shewanella algae]